MNWDALGALAELLGALAVLVTVAFLALQMRQNTKALRSESMNSALASTQNWYLQMGMNAQAAQVWMKGIQTPDECTQVEYAQFVGQVQAMLISHQATFRLGMQEALDADIRGSLNRILLNIKDQPGFEQFWAERRDQFDAPFRQFIDEIVASKEVSGGSSLYQERQG